MLSTFTDDIKNAIGIEVHNRNEMGYKPDANLVNMYVLISAFTDRDRIVPVKLEVKEFYGKMDNSLHVVVSLEGKKKDEIVTIPTINGENMAPSPNEEKSPSTIIVAVFSD